MVEEFMGSLESGEIWSGGVEKVSEVAVQKVQEEARQAKQVAQQLKKDKAKNDQFAQFLTFLMQEIKNEQIIKGLYETFFTTIDYKTNITYLRKDMNSVVVVGVFYPFFKEKGEEIWLGKYFDQLLPEKEQLSIRKYISYLQELSNHYHDNIPINQSDFINLLVVIIQEYLKNASDAPSLTAKEDPQEAYKNLTYQYLNE